MGAQQIHQGRLALLHLGQGLINPGGLAVVAWCGGHGGGKQHARADGFDQHQGIAGVEWALGPGATRTAAIHREGQGEGARSRGHAPTCARFQGVAADQLSAHRFEHRAHAGQGLGQKLLLDCRWALGHGDQGLGAVHLGT